MNKQSSDGGIGLMVPLNDSEMVQGLKKKIKYLTKELQDSQESNKKLTELLESSQISLQFMTNSHRNPTSAKTTDSNQTGANNYVNAMAALNRENRVLLEIIKDLMNERSIAQCKGLLLEQIMDMTETEYKLVLRSLSKEIQEIKKDKGNFGIQSATSPRQQMLAAPVNSQENRSQNPMVSLQSSAIS